VPGRSSQRDNDVCRVWRRALRGRSGAGVAWPASPLPTGEGETAVPTLYHDVETKNVKAADLPWVPFTPYRDDVFLKYYRIDPVRGEILVSMKFPPGIVLPTHYHTGIVIGHTVRGAWRYVEHDWVSEAGDTVFETAGSAHTPQAVGDVESEAWFLIVGELEFVDADGNLLARENWKTSLQRYHDFCTANGVEAQDLTGFEVG
jgi:quercetin dioxygenase-like cupin family protein